MDGASSAGDEDQPVRIEGPGRLTPMLILQLILFTKDAVQNLDEFVTQDERATAIVRLECIPHGATPAGSE